MKAILENKWWVSISAGILLGLSFPPINLSILVFPAFVLLFHLNKLTNSYKELAYVSYPAFVIWNLITTYWLMMASLAAGIAAILANAVLMTIPLCIGKFAEKRFSSAWVVVLVQAFSWVGYEYFHHNWDLGWPWLTVGNAWANYPSLVSYISITGMLGISFWVLFTSALLYRAWYHKQNTIRYAALSTLLIFPVLSFVVQLSKSSTQDEGQTTVTIVQPNFDSYHRFGGYESQDVALDIALSVSDSARTSNTQLIIWPENSVDTYLRDRSLYKQRIADSAYAWNTDVLFGSGYEERYTDDLPTMYRERASGAKYNVFNVANYINTQNESQIYKKRSLVPIVERMPFVHFLAAIDVFEWVDWGKAAGFGKGTEPVTFSNPSGFVTPGLVCYDSVFPGWVRQFVNEGANFLTVITNDGWWGNTSGHHQHFAYARLRAIEFDRWIARSANNGISGIIAPDGSIKMKTEYWERTGFTYNIGLRSSQTIYAAYGDWLAASGSVFVMLVWLYGYFRKPSSNESQS